MKSKIINFETACKFMGYSTKLPAVKGLPEHLAKPLIADYEMSVINEALTKEHFVAEKRVFPDWSKASEWKYYPWWRVQADEKHPSGSGLSSYDCDYSDAYTGVGSRFCLPTSDLVEYSVKKFKKLHQMRMIGK